MGKCGKSICRVTPHSVGGRGVAVNLLTSRRFENPESSFLQCRQSTTLRIVREGAIKKGRVKHRGYSLACRYINDFETFGIAAGDQAQRKADVIEQKARLVRPVRGTDTSCCVGTSDHADRT